MIDFSMDELMELARQAELQKRVEADEAGVETITPWGLSFPASPATVGAYTSTCTAAFAAGYPAALPEDLRGKLGEADEAEGDSASARSP